MALLTKTMKVQDLEKDLGRLVKENFLDLVVGSMQVTQGTLLLLFSHRFNKEIGVVVTGSHDRAEINKRTAKILEELS